jgi:hypothetical protein
MLVLLYACVVEGSAVKAVFSLLFLEGFMFLAYSNLKDLIWIKEDG